MIVRGIEVEHWRCIEHVSLQGLPSGIIVIHAPNRKGKSSLFEAVRSCLYDYDHDSGGRTITSAIPWRTKAPPKVVVDFEVKGTRYQVTKVFSKGKEGTARLERWVNGRWVVEVREPKEASRRVRELLGAEKSDAGLNQLLWLEQGQTKLPQPKDLDPSLEKRLENVLGTLVTGQDLEFRKLLEERCGRWFTSTMKHRGGKTSPSPVLQLRDQKQKCERALEEINGKLQAAEGMLRQYEDKQVEVAGLEKEVEKARSEVSGLQQEKEASRDRREAHDQARQALETAQERLARARQAVTDYEETEKRLASAEKRLHKAEESFNEMKLKAEGVETEHKMAVEEAKKAREVEDRHIEKRKEIDDRQKLLQAHRSLRDLDKNIKKVREFEKEIEKLERGLSGPVAPSEEEVKRLRKQRDEIRRLRAELEAAGLYVEVEPERETAGKVNIDTDRSKPAELRPGKPQRWQARQRIRLALEGMGRIEVGRGEEDVDLERTAKRLQTLEQEHGEWINQWKEDPSSAEALDRLTERRVRREAWAEKLQEAKNGLESLAPQGVAALESEKRRLEQVREGILKQRPQLKEWEPSENELTRLLDGFQRESKRLMLARQEAERKSQKLGGELRQVESDRDNARNNLTAEQVSRKGIRDELKRLGDPATLKKALAQAEGQEQEARREVEKTALTEAEQTIDERLGKAREALDKRQERLGQAQTRLSEYRGELRSTEGLHTDRVRAEQELNAVSRALEEEELEAEAHMLLFELFDSCRESQIRRTMGPIAQRVLAWAKHLGLDEYTEVAFGDRFLPQGVVSRDAGPEEAAIPFSEESYGTEEQLALLVRLALGGILAADEPEVAILDDPLAHSDPAKHRHMLDILKWAAEGAPSGGGEQQKPGKLQIFILTCHPERFDYLPGAKHIDFLARSQRPLADRGTEGVPTSEQEAP